MSAAVELQKKKYEQACKQGNGKISFIQGFDSGMTLTLEAQEEVLWASFAKALNVENAKGWKTGQKIIQVWKSSWGIK